MQILRGAHSLGCATVELRRRHWQAAERIDMSALAKPIRRLMLVR